MRWECENVVLSYSAPPVPFLEGLYVSSPSRDWDDTLTGVEPGTCLLASEGSSHPQSQVVGEALGQVFAWYHPWSKGKVQT